MSRWHGQQEDRVPRCVALVAKQRSSARCRARDAPWHGPGMLGLRSHHLPRMQLLLLRRREHRLAVATVTLTPGLAASPLSASRPPAIGRCHRRCPAPLFALAHASSSFLTLVAATASNALKRRRPSDATVGLRRRPRGGPRGPGETSREAPRGNTAAWQRPGVLESSPSAPAAPGRPRCRRSLRCPRSAPAPPRLPRTLADAENAENGPDARCSFAPARAARFASGHMLPRARPDLLGLTLAACSSPSSDPYARRRPPRPLHDSPPVFSQVIVLARSLLLAGTLACPANGLRTARSVAVEACCS